MQNCITNIETKTNNVLGISSAGSKKCKDMLDKVHMIQKNNDGKGIVFATGIPITNSITDAYVMQKYLQYGELKLSAMYALTSAMVYYARKHKYDMPRIANSIKYADRMPPAFLDELSDSELDFVMMHEILHVVLQLPENMNTQAITLKKYGNRDMIIL